MLEIPGKAGNRTRDRVRGALAAMGLSLPARRVAVSLSPADVLDAGSQYDLPVALVVLTAMGLLPSEELSGYAAMTSLFPDGSLQAVAGILPAAVAASGLELGLICPASHGGEAAWAGSLEVLAAPDLLAIINHFRGTQVLSPPRPAGVRAAGPLSELADLRGMETAKRALEIAAAGGHGLMLVGPPGVGKAALAACLPGLLPDLSPAEALEVSMIHSVAGTLDGGRLFRRPPFRAPLRGTSRAALMDGGQRAVPGEMSLAHLGVLFLDHPAECSPGLLEPLHQRSYAGDTTGAHGMARDAFRPRFQLVVAMAPCPCGHLGNPSRECGEAPSCGKDHPDRSCGALIDRIDLFVHVHPISQVDPAGAPAAEPSGVVAERVRVARAWRLARWGDHGSPRRGDAGAAVIDCQPEARELAKEAAARLRLSTEGLSRLLRVARTVADLGNSRWIRPADVAEALAYRRR